MFSEATAVFGVITTVLMLYIAFKVYRKAPPWVDEKIEGFVATFLEPDEQGKNVVDQLAERFGKGFRMSLLAQKSGEVRHQKGIEKRVFQAIKENVPEVRLGIKAAESFGLGDLVEEPEDAMALMSVLKRFGIDPMSLLKGNSPGGGEREGYGGRM